MRRHHLRICFDDDDPSTVGGTISCELNGTMLLQRRPLVPLEWDRDELLDVLADQTFIGIQRAAALDARHPARACLQWGDADHFQWLVEQIAMSLHWTEILRPFGENATDEVVAIETEILTVPFHLLAEGGTSCSLYAHGYLPFYVPPGLLARRPPPLSTKPKAVVAHGPGKNAAEGRHFETMARELVSLLRTHTDADAQIFDARENRALEQISVDPEIFVWVGHSGHVEGGRFGQELNGLTGQELMDLDWIKSLRLALLIGCLTAIPHILIEHEPQKGRSVPVSLVEPFLRVGARVLASQWIIPQERSFQFARELLSRLSPDRNLLSSWAEAEEVKDSSGLIFTTPSGLIFLSSDPGDDWYL